MVLEWSYDFRGTDRTKTPTFWTSMVPCGHDTILVELCFVFLSSKCFPSFSKYTLRL